MLAASQSASETWTAAHAVRGRKQVPTERVGKLPAWQEASASASPAYTGGESSMSEEQTARLHALWQEKMDQQREHWEGEMAAGQEQRQALNERILSCTAELKEVQAQLLTTRQQLVPAPRNVNVRL